MAIKMSPGCGCCNVCAEEFYNFNATDPTDWSNAWDKTASEVEYTRKSGFDTANYEFGVAYGSWFGTSGKKFTIELIDDPAGAATVVFSQVFEVWIDPAPVERLGGTYYRHYLRSTGTAGTLYHGSVLDANSSLHASEVRGIRGDFSTVLRVRDDTIEMRTAGGGSAGLTSNNGSPDVQYEYQPIMMASQAGLNLYGRFKLEGGSQPGSLNGYYNELIHEADGKHLNCPPGTCQLVDPYQHLPWRVSNEVVGGATVVPYTEIIHQGCTVTIGHDPLPPLTTPGTSAIGYADVFVVWKHPTQETVFRPIGTGYYVTGGTPYLGSRSRAYGGIAPSAVCAPAQIVGPVGPGWVSAEFFGGDPEQFRSLSVFSRALDTGVDPVDCGDPADWVPICNFHHNAGSYWEVDTATISETEGFVMRDGTADDISPASDNVGISWVIRTIDPLSDRTFSATLAQVASDQLGTIPPNHYYAISGDAGGGLLFEHTDAGVYDCKKQITEPINQGVLTAQQQSDIASLLTGSGVVYWYKNGGDHYSISSSGQAGPFGSTGWTAPAVELVVRAEATIDFYQYNNIRWSGVPESQTTYVVYGVPGFANDGDFTDTTYEDTLPPAITRPDDNLDEYKRDPLMNDQPSAYHVNLDLWYLEASPFCGGQLDYYYDESTETEYYADAVTLEEFGWRISTEVTTGDEFTITSTSCVEVDYTPSIRTFGPVYDGAALPRDSETWTESGRAYAGNMLAGADAVSGNFSGNLAAAIWERVIAQPSHVTSLPTINFSGADLVSEDSDLKILSSVTFQFGDWSAENPQAWAETFKITYSHNRIFLSDITFTVSL